MLFLSEEFCRGVFSNKEKVTNSNFGILKKEYKFFYISQKLADSRSLTYFFLPIHLRNGFNKKNSMNATLKKYKFFIK